MEKVWKDIKGYEGLYQVSNTGHVRALNYSGTKGFVKELVLAPNAKGYLRVGLTKNRKQRYHRVHRLVYETFIGEIPEKMEINHKDENRQNNNLENLEICSHTYNVNYGTRLARLSKRMSGAGNPFFGRRHSEETKRKISETKKLHKK